MMRYVRYAAAVVFALVGVAFVALWVRSYVRQDNVLSPTYGTIRLPIMSNAGAISCAISWQASPNRSNQWRWAARESNPKVNGPVAGSTYVRALGFELAHGEHFRGVMVPHWFLAASSFAMAALFAFKRTWRFSLRSVLVATTILAALLGLAVYWSS